MYSFVAGAGLAEQGRARGLTVGQLLAASARAIVDQLPPLGAPFTLRVVELPEVDGGWATLRPDIGAGLDLLSEWSDAELAILVLGELSARVAAAEALRDAWKANGAAGVLQLDGVFSALVLERPQRRLNVFTSVPGCQSLHYSHSGGTLVLSPLDVGVVALSGCEVRLDLPGMAAMVAGGWPLGGGGALAGVQETQPYEQLVWSARTLERRAVNPISVAARVAPQDVAGVASKLEELVAELRSSVALQLERLYPGSQRISVPLTAGVDSRAVLSLCLSLVDKRRIETYTRGSGGQDVRVAKRLSAELGLPHETRPVEPSCADTFLANARFLAIATNAIANAEAAIGPRFEVARSPPVPFGGGGEVFRGFYYNYLRRGATRPTGPRDVAAALLGSPLRQLVSTPLVSAELAAALRQRVTQTLERLAVISADPFDLSDLFYVLERMGRWGSSLWRRALGPCFVPFASGRAMRALFQLPSPVGDHAILPALITRYAGRPAYLTAVNGAEFLFLEGPGRFRHVSREALRLYSRLLRQGRQRLRRQERTPKQTRLAALQGSLHEVLSDSVENPRSVARDLFSAQQRKQLVTQRGGRREAALLGALLSLDLLRQSLEETRRRARR